MRPSFHALVIAPSLLCAAPAIAADESSLVGIHNWGLKDGTMSHWDGVDDRPAQFLGSRTHGAWDVEVINTHGEEWQKATFFQPLYNELYRNKNVSLITRIEYQYNRTVPSPTQINTSAWADDVVGTINKLKDAAHIWQLGNEPNLIDEGRGWANNTITPNGYASIYKTVRERVHANAQVGAPGAHQVLVAPVSPGGVINGVRWMDGNQWLGRTLDAIKALGSPIDGVGIHAYGAGYDTPVADSLREFRSDVATQVAIVDSRGFTDVPLHITELNRYTNPAAGNAAGQEAKTAEFVRRAFRELDRWNRTPGNHNIVSATWFVYDSYSPFEGHSLEYWKTHGHPEGHPGDLWTAYAEVARAGYQAGLPGTRPMPAGVRVIDDFEANDGRFSQAPAATGASATRTRTADDSYTRSYAQFLRVVDNPTNDQGWYVRQASGGGSVGSNEAIPLTDGPDGHVGFFLRLAAATNPAAPLYAQLILDSGPTGGGADSDAGIPLQLIGDGEWHYYEWNLDDDADWTAWRDRAGNVLAGSDGLLPSTGQVSIDSIVLRGGNTNAEFYLDGVMRNTNGSLSAMLPVPEPTTLGFVPLAAAILLQRRSRKH
jgi:hypothetical protein